MSLINIARFNVTLQDPSTGENKAATIIVSPSMITIQVDGYGEQSAENGKGEPIMVEFYEGKLYVRAWHDINEGDPVTIDMEKALESNRKTLTD